jgi:hypothetical protein
LNPARGFEISVGVWVGFICGVCFVFSLDAAVFEKVLQILFDRYPETLKPLHVSDESPFKVLVGALLSHRTRDENTTRPTASFSAATGAPKTSPKQASETSRDLSGRSGSTGRRPAASRNSPA